MFEITRPVELISSPGPASVIKTAKQIEMYDCITKSKMLPQKIPFDNFTLSFCMQEHEQYFKIQTNKYYKHKSTASQ